MLLTLDMQFPHIAGHHAYFQTPRQPTSRFRSLAEKQSDPTTLLHIVLRGARSVATNGAPTAMDKNLHISAPRSGSPAASTGCAAGAWSSAQISGEPCRAVVGVEHELDPQPVPAPLLDLVEVAAVGA
jgi:hypothetical protein